MTGMSTDAVVGREGFARTCAALLTGFFRHHRAFDAQLLLRELPALPLTTDSLITAARSLWVKIQCRELWVTGFCSVMVRLMSSLLVKPAARGPPCNTSGRREPRRCAGPSIHHGRTWSSA